LKCAKEEERARMKESNIFRKALENRHAFVLFLYKQVAAAKREPVSGAGGRLYGRVDALKLSCHLELLSRIYCLFDVMSRKLSFYLVML